MAILTTGGNSSAPEKVGEEDRNSWGHSLSEIQEREGGGYDIAVERHRRRNGSDWNGDEKHRRRAQADER